jgi:phage shock protein A
MSSLFRKFNTLVRARIEGFLEEDLRLPLGTRKDDSAPADPLSEDTRKQIASLRKRINEAIIYEEDLQTKIEALHQDASDLDLQADNALLDNDETAARHAAEQLKRTRQQIRGLERDLSKHRDNTSALMDHVNMLEGLVADARAQASSQDTVATQEQEDTPQVVRVNVSTENEEQIEDSTADYPEIADGQDTPESGEDSLAVRRARLARRNPDKEE